MRPVIRFPRVVELAEAADFNIDRFTERTPRNFFEPDSFKRDVRDHANARKCCKIISSSFPGVLFGVECGVISAYSDWAIHTRRFRELNLKVEASAYDRTTWWARKSTISGEFAEKTIYIAVKATLPINKTTIIVDISELGNIIAALELYNIDICAACKEQTGGQCISGYDISERRVSSILGNELFSLEE